MKFSIITCTRNNEKWIKNNIDSVKNQTYQNYEHIIIDDASTDSSLNVIKDSCDLSKTLIFSRRNRAFALRNHILGLKKASGDIIVHLDGDDWFIDNYVLQYIKDVYDKTGCWATYGNWQHKNPEITWRMGPLRTNNPKDIRKQREWAFTHLRTFKKELISCIPAMDVFDEFGNTHEIGADVALLLGIYEYAVSQNKAQYIEKPLVIYNSDTGQNDHILTFQSQANTAFQVYASPYSIINLLK